MEIAEIRFCVMHMRMDRPMPFDWTQARAFLATVEAGSLSQAAKVLGLEEKSVAE